MKYLLTIACTCLLALGGYAQCESNEMAFLGIYTDNMTKEKAKKLQFKNPYGSYVSSIIKNTAAERLGLEAFDYVVAVNKEAVSREKNLTRLLRQHKTGEEVNISFIRRGTMFVKSVELGTKSTANYTKRSRDEDPFLGVTQDNSTCFKKYEGARINVVGNSSAKDLGLQNGDLITAINGYPVYDWHDLTAGINRLQVGEVIDVSYVREGRTEQNKTTIRSLASTKRKENHYYTYNEQTQSRQVKPNTNQGFNFELEERDVSRMAINMEEISEEEATNMNADYAIDMPLDNNLSIANLNLSPNPNMGMFDLRFRLKDKGDTIINIYNALGRTIYTYELADFSGVFTDAIDISQNGVGLYFLEIRQANKSIVKKVVLKAS